MPGSSSAGRVQMVPQSPVGHIMPKTASILLGMSTTLHGGLLVKHSDEAGCCARSRACEARASITRSKQTHSP